MTSKHNLIAEAIDDNSEKIRLAAIWKGRLRSSKFVRLAVTCKTGHVYRTRKARR